jgi:hypothetical protein
VSPACVTPRRSLNHLRRCAEASVSSILAYARPSARKHARLGDRIPLRPQHRFPRNKVKSRKQAIAIGLSKARKKGSTEEKVLIRAWALN